MDLKVLHFTVFGAPISINKLYYNRGRRGRILSEEGKKFKRDVGYIALEAMRKRCIEKTSEPISIYIQFFFPTRRGDVDNCVKALLDGLSRVVWNDDSQVADNTSGNYGNGYRFRQITEKHKDKENPRTEITIRFYES